MSIKLAPGETRQIDVALTPIIVLSFASVRIHHTPEPSGTLLPLPANLPLNTSVEGIVWVQSNVSGILITTQVCLIDPDGIKRGFKTTEWIPAQANLPYWHWSDSVILDKTGIWYLWARAESSGVAAVEESWKAIVVEG